MKYQQGSTLVMVLIVLLLITLIGTMAMRESLLNLRLSTNAQVNNVLLNSNDTALFELEDAAKVRGRLNSQSVYGYFDSGTNADDELVFCFDVKETRFFSMSRASVIGSTKRGPNGYCKVDKFSTGRDATISQVYVRKLNFKATPLSTLPLGTEAGQDKLSNLKFVAATTISILPRFSKANPAAIENCFKMSAIKNDSSTASNNVEMCFQALNIPYNMQYSAYSVGSAPN